MNISATDAALSIQAQTATRTITNDSQQLGKDEFLELLIAQMQNQDPLDPMDNTESIAQMAQFSSLEQMENLNANISNYISSQQSGNVASGVQFIGKEVEGIVNDAIVKGKVIGVESKDNKVFLKLETANEDGEVENVLLNATEVYTVNSIIESAIAKNQNAIVTGAQFIGKQVKAENGEGGNITGEVLTASVKNMEVMLKIKTDNDEKIMIKLSQITEVGEELS